MTTSSIRFAFRLSITFAILSGPNFAEAKITSFIKGSDPRFDSAGNVVPDSQNITSLTVKSFVVPAPRATIRDAKGKIIAHDIIQKRLAIWLKSTAPDEARETFIADNKTVSEVLGRDLSAPTPLSFADRGGAPVVFSQILSPKEIDAIERLNSTRIGFIEVPVRNYPYGAALAHAVGWAAQPMFVTRGTLYNAPVGQTGVESLLESKLKGTAGRYTVISDSSDHSLKTIDEEPPRAAADLSLTIDAEMQKGFDKYFRTKIKQGAVVLSEVATGAVRVMLSYPTFDPNTLSPYINGDVYKALEKLPGSPLVNRIFQPYYAADCTAVRCEQELQSPLEMLAQIQHHNSNLNLIVTDPSSTDQIPQEFYGPKFRMRNVRAGGEVAVVTIANGKYLAVVALDGEDVQKMQSTLTALSGNLSRAVNHL